MHNTATQSLARRKQTAWSSAIPGRISSEVLDINVTSRRALEQLLRGFNQAYNARCQRVLDGRTPNQVTAEHLTAKPELANPAPHGRADPCDITKARLIVDAAKEASQPDSALMVSCHRHDPVGHLFSVPSRIIADSGMMFPHRCRLVEVARHAAPCGPVHQTTLSPALL